MANYLSKHDLNIYLEYLNMRRSHLKCTAIWNELDNETSYADLRYSHFYGIKSE
jgi:hypothetical protein